MGFLRVLPPLFLVFLFYTNFATSQKNCPVRCGGDEREPKIHFPFGVNGDERQSCGYPGFNLSCNNNGTVLDLGSSGKFMVRGIDYVTRAVAIYDQENCLPKRLMNLNLSNSPFKSAYSWYVGFYNCSSPPDPSYRIDPIPCLSTSNYSIYATTSPNPTIIPSCEFINSVAVPAWPVYPFGYPAVDIYKHLFLMWDTPDCTECVVRGGQCGFKNSKSSEVECFNLRKRGNYLSYLASRIGL
ncbi:hypothetical protein IFM89_024417 [Coptis chinensis]|uniref:RING-type E3 ubiquitin transferase n=1 Tax=Coptis chinensis TaxID=261450 RepID=A0A835HP40_9MAGN|nr:hypothetical protein IFM89_024417 [Coptis chinensis]